MFMLTQHRDDIADDQMFKDRPIRQNEGPVTTTHEITPTNIPKPTGG